MRHAVGSDFEGELRFYAGTSIGIALIDGAPILANASRDAWTCKDRPTAERVADELTEFCALTAATWRTWFIVELPEARQ